ncbi:MAG: hypothetical protein JW723_09550 [Bacteroidales bacterium]|nr:hypothetical protein [Bacteroidales bacterium]
MGFLRTLLVIILIYYLWKILFRYVIIPLLRKSSNVTGNERSRQHKTTRRDGETTIDFIPDKKKIISKDKGEYVDYEEHKK